MRISTFYSRLMQPKNPRRTLARAKNLPIAPRSFLESLEPRTLFSESATAQLNLVSTGGTVQTPVYNYDITVTNTGTTTVGTFWFGWTPGQDYLPSIPSAESSPGGWGNSTGTSSTPFLSGNTPTSPNSNDGTSIQWVAQSGSEVAAGQSLSGFTFSTTDSPDTLAAASPKFPSKPAMTTEVYAHGLFSDGGFILVVAPVQASLAGSITMLGTSNPTVNFGDNVTLTATVASASGTGATPTGTVTFTQGSTTLGTVPVQGDGTAMLATTTLPAGADSINATYNGDSTYTSSVSSPLSETVNAIIGTTPSQTTVGTSSEPATNLLPVVFTATVAPVTPGGPTPTGMVSFTLDGSPLSMALIQSDGTAAVSTTLAVGAHTITATYAGDSTYAASVSSTLMQTVIQAPTLAPAVVKSTIPSALVMGAKVHGTVTVIITNETAATIKGLTILQIFATANGIIDGSAMVVGQVTRRLNLKSNKSTRIPVPIKALLAALPANTYTLLASTTDPSANVTSAGTGPAVQVAAPFIALTEAFTKQTLTGAALAGAKTRAVAAIQITNTGNIITPGLTTIAFYLSTNGTVDSNAALIRSVTKPLRIRPGKSMIVSLPLKQVPVVPVENYTVVAQVTDANGQTSIVVSGNLVTINPA